MTSPPQSDAASPSSGFQIFRVADAQSIDELGVMDYGDLSPVIAEGLRAFGAADQGSHTRLLLDIPGFSLAYAWFKSRFPLPCAATTSIASTS